MVGHMFIGRPIQLVTAAFLLIAPQFIAPLVTPSLAATGDRARSEEFLQDAKNYLEKGDVNAAIIQLKNALQQDPAYIAARRLLGKIYLQIGNGPYAEKELRAALKRQAGGHEIRFMLAKAYLMQGKFNAVLDEIADDPSDAETRVTALMLRGRAYLGRHRLNESEAAFKEVIRLQPQTIPAMVGLARILILRKKLGDAEAMIDKVLTDKSDEVEILNLKAELRRLQRDLKGAVTHYDRAIAIQPQGLPSRLGRAASLLDMNRDTEAKADLDVVLARVPKHPFASYLLALILAKKKDFAGAQDALLQGGPLLNNHLPSLFLSGAINYALNQTEQAVQTLTRYVELAPANAKAVKLLAAALIRGKEPGKAIEYLEPLLAKGGKDTRLLTLAGSAYMRMGQFNKGTAMFQQAAKAAPDVAAIRTQLALGRLFSGQSDQAIGDLEAAINLDPEARRASILLTLVQLRKGKFDEALKSATTLSAKMPGNPMPQNLIGAAHLGKKDIKKAREYFERALKTKPDFHPARMNLAQLDLREKNIDAAIKKFEWVVEKDPKHINAMLALATIAERQKRERDAQAWLRKAGEADSNAALPRVKLVEFYGRRREFQKAVAVARNLVQIAPGNPQALVALGRTETALGEHVSAVATFRKLTEMAPKSASAFSLLAGAQMAAKNDVAARKSLLKAISLDDSVIPVHVALAKLEVRAGRTEEGLKIAASLQKKHLDAAAGYVVAGDIYMRIKNYDDAMKAYEVAQEKENTGAIVLRRFNAGRLAGQAAAAFARFQGWVDDKNSRPMRHVLASAYINAKRYDDAIRESERLFAKDEKNPILLNNLAWLYDQKGDERAVKMAERALEIAPKSPAVMDTLGWILVRRGNLDAGIRHLETASGLAPNQGDIAYHHAVALQKSGKVREARRKLKKLFGAGIKFSEFKNAKALLKDLGG